MEAPGGQVVWIGRAISILASLAFLLSASIKVMGGPELDQGLAHLGLPASMVLPLAILEIIQRADRQQEEVAGPPCADGAAMV